MIGVYDETGGGAADADAGRLIQIVRAAAEQAFSFEGKRGDADITLVPPETMRQRNSAFRGKDSVTDVLSFPATEGGKPPPDGFWGDILICPARAEEQAKEYGHSLTRELAFLAVHGALHLLGYDHENEQERLRMQRRQESILERMGLTR